MTYIFEDKLGDRLAKVMIIVAILSVIAAVGQYAYADDPGQKTKHQEQTLIFGMYPDPYPAKEYYLSKMVHHHLMLDPEPLPQYRLDDIKKMKCGSWAPIKGQIPLASGLLMSMAISEAEPHHIVIANYGHTGFIGYLHIPCNEATLGMYDVYFTLWNHPTVWGLQFIEEPQRIHMKVEVTP